MPKNLQAKKLKSYKLKAKKLKSYKLQAKNKGFTLPEVLISVGLFSIIIAITSSIFLIALRSQRHIISAVNSNDNLSYALEVMARDIRTGRLFFNPLPEEISFLNYKNQAVVYRLNNETIEKSLGGQTFEALTSNNIRILDLKFLTQGEKRFDSRQIFVTIIIKALSKFGNQEVVQSVQTSISPRDLEVFVK